ncbi:MAG TPA: glycosyltransferase family 4 protein [Solirubrobacterales bacterium]|nr:glycosyltransferase family 4 protein [Solirubrobacterales bacterium]
MSRQSSGLRVLMVTPRSPLGQGGSERHVMEVSRRLAAQGVEVEVLCADSPDAGLTEELRDGVPIRSVRRYPANRDYYLAPRLWPEMARDRWDVVHVQSYHTLVAPLAMLRALTLRVPYVVTFHSGGHSSRLRHGLRGGQRRALRPLFARAARLIAIAQFELELYSRELRLPRDRFALIPNGSDIAAAEPATGASAAAAGGSSETVLASIGRLERYKGHQGAIEALPHLLARRPDARLLIVGTGPYEEELRRRAAQLGVAERVEFTSLPAEDRAGMARLLQRTSLVVLLSEYETHPLTALEAAAAGRPLVVVDRAGLGEVARDGLARAVPAGAAPAAVAAAIAEELKSPSTSRTPRLASWDECAAALLALYESVA